MSPARTPANPDPARPAVTHRIPTGSPRVLVVLGHPRSESLCGALAESYAGAARAAGAEVEVLRLGEVGFDLASSDPALLRWEAEQAGREPQVEQMIDAVRRADHLLLVFPQWWGTYPAVLKGYLDRVFLSRFAFASRGADSARWDKLLTGRTARLVMTMDSPVWWDRLKYRSAAVNSLVHATLWYCGIRTVGVTRLPRVKSSTPRRRAGWIALVERQARTDVRRATRRPRALPAGTEQLATTRS